MNLSDDKHIILSIHSKTNVSKRYELYVNIIPCPLLPKANEKCMVEKNVWLKNVDPNNKM